MVMKLNGGFNESCNYSIPNSWSVLQKNFLSSCSDSQETLISLEVLGNQIHSCKIMGSLPLFEWKHGSEKYVCYCLAIVCVVFVSYLWMFYPSAEGNVNSL